MLEKLKNHFVKPARTDLIKTTSLVFKNTQSIHQRNKCAKRVIAAAGGNNEHT